MKKLHIVFVFLLLSVIGFGQLVVTVPTITAAPGQTVNVPVKVYGAGSSGVPLSSINLKVTYESTMLSFVNLVNFYEGTPEVNWIFSGNFQEQCNSVVFAANWLEPSLDTLAIPDGTTLYEIQFVYNGGACPLNFCISEFTDVNYDLIGTTALNGGVNMADPSPVLSGPTLVCVGSSANVYTTNAGNTNYTWTVTGGSITAGGTSSDHTATVAWNSTGPQLISVSYTGSTTAILPVTVLTNPVPMSVSIAASANPVCANTSVTFTATPVNVGATPVYQWKKNNANVGSNNATYSYNPVNNDVITCVVTSNEPCVSGNPATSNSLTMTVNPLTASVSIAASANPVVAGTSVTFTATPVNGGATPAYQWKVNGSDAGTGGSTFSYAPVEGDVIYCLLTSNAPCVTSVFTSNLVTMTVTNPVVNPLLVTVSTKTAIPGQKVFFPVKLKGASASGAPVSSANIKIAYDPAVLSYDTLINFYEGTPTGQWYFTGINDTVAANWIEPSLLALAIPDSTTLFDIRFTYIGGTATLPFTVNEFTDASYNFITTNHVDGGINSITPLSGYLACDFHQHTTYTDGSYSFGYMMQKNNQFGLDWWANSEHGGGFNRDGRVTGIDLGNIATPVYFDSYIPNPIIGTYSASGGHQNMWRWQSLRDYSFPNIQTARATYSSKMIFQGYELNVPGHEHASMGLINNQFNANANCNPLAEFEFKFDGSDADVTGGVAQGWTKSALSGHAKAVEAVSWLHTNYPSTSYLIAAHPERKSLNNIQGFRDMNNAGPDVCFGFESMPGHQKAADRGEYKTAYNTFGTSTYGGCGIYSAQIGGLWDAMLSEGRSWWLFASSDFHSTDADFYPGEYQKTYAYITDRTNPQSYIDGLRSGNSFVVEGDLIDSLDFRVGETAAMALYATMGQTLSTTQNSVVVKIKVRDPQGNNNNSFSAYTNPAVDHIDLIQGKVTGLVAPGSPNYSVGTVSTTAVIARFDAVGGVTSPNGIVSQAWTDLGGGIKEITYTYNNLVDSVYFRLRGTNQGLNVTNETDANGNPLTDAMMYPNDATKAFADLWFYSNPVFVSGPVSPSLSGPTTVCQGSTGNVYTTDAGQTNYTWTVTGGSITAGGGNSDNTATISWNTVGNQVISVSYSSSVTTELPVVVNSLPSPVISGSSIICGAGSATLDAGTGYTAYSWSTGATTQTINAIAGGFYTVTVTNSNGCSGVAQREVIQSSPVVATSSAGTIACSGGTTTVSVSATGGTPPYTGTGDFIRGAGTYSFTVTDANGCSGNTNITITDPPLFMMKSTQSSTNGAEISAYDSASNRIFTVAGPAIEYYTLSNVGVLSGSTNIPFGFTPPVGTTALPNSVAVKNGVVAVSYALVGANNAQQQGRVAFYSAATAAYISDVTVGYLPDMVAFTPDGTKVLTADEGEPNSYGQATSFDPEGSVSIIDISGGVASATVTIAGFTGFNAQLASLKAAGVRIYGPGATVAMDLEPEYLTFSPDGMTAYITLQENNAVAKLNIATATLTDIYPLGLKDHSLAGNGLDASDRDVNGTSGGGGKINIQNWPIKGMYEPDGIASFTVGADTYYITANEGDSRDYTGFSEEVRVSDAGYVLDPVVFPNAAFLKLPANLGRLQLTKATGSTDGDSQFEEIQAFGARSFTIWNSSFSRVFDSQDQLEQITAVRNSAGFNSDGTAASFDSRSDNKGAEPEGVAVGIVNGIQYAFIGSERTGDLFIYDITDPSAPVFKQYINTPADLGVEGVHFVPASQSPTGKALVITSSEVSKTVTVYEFSAAPVIMLTGNATEEICQNATYTDAGATAVDNQGTNITGSIVTSNLVNTAVPGTYTVTYNVTDACGIAALPVTRTVIVNPILAIGISIAASANPVCAGTPVTFTATETNGGATLVYQWKKGNSNVGTNSPTFSYSPANNDVITCIATSGANCISGSPATSNAITMTVNPLVSTISIAASATNVVAGTPVTFTATPVNGGSTPVYQWKVNSNYVGTNSATFTYNPANGDAVYCLLTPNAPCVTSTFTSNVITMVVTNPPVNPLLVTISTITAIPGEKVYFQVKLKGAGSTGSPISGASIQIPFDPAVLQYDTLVNFYSEMPYSQWSFSGNLDMVAANWIEPSLLTLPVPDSTTLFEIQFTYLGGTGTLPFTVTEFTDALYDFIPTNHIDGGITQLVPTNSTVQNVTVASGFDTCFNALNTITVAGNGTTFDVQPGGSATFVAGQRINFLPGTTVIANGYLHGYITTNGQYCTQLANPVVAALTTGNEVTTSVPEIFSNQSIRVYPNPTTGMFTVEVKGDSKVLMTNVEIFTMSGLKIHAEMINNEQKHSFSLPGMLPGIYFIHVSTTDKPEILKLVKL